MNPDFRRLWTGSAISQLGSAVGMVAIPIIAINQVRASPFQVALLGVLAAGTTAVLAFPIGRVIEFRRKRPVMIATDLARCLALLSLLPLPWVTYPHLCLVAVINATGIVSHAAASQSHLKALVTREELIEANSRLESTRWLSISVGPSVGGALVGLFSATVVLLADALSFLASALAVRRLRTPEPDPPERVDGGSRREEIFAGWRFARGHRVLMPMLVSWVGFAGGSAMAAGVAAYFYLNDLGFTEWQYGLLMGVPSLGGFLGARLAPRLAVRLGQVRALWWASQLRGPWYFLIALAVPGPVGLAMCGVGFGMVLLFAGAANSTMTAYRQAVTPHELMSRVTALWAFATTVAQPLFMVLGGLLATWFDSRTTLLVATVVMCSAALRLPRAA
ncbi:MFS transporter [Nonomuraea sp. NPDC050663]|uniref:MFS transporter n=1 Tax=Nonomuraea sp. NPDC050663 TaxID=3364370 RepID=UPI0037A34CC2